MIKVSKWNPDLIYSKLNFPGVEFVDGIDFGDLSNYTHILFTIDLYPAALTANFTTKTSDQGIMTHSLEWELPQYSTDEQEVKLMDSILTCCDKLIYPNGYETLTNDEVLVRLSKLMIVVEMSIFPEKYKTPDKVREESEVK